jgi:hypothetical protein
VATASRAVLQSGQPYETGRPYGLTPLSVRAPLREQVRPGVSERHVSAGRMQHDPAVREPQGPAVARLNVCRCLSGKPGAVRSQQARKVGAKLVVITSSVVLAYRRCELSLTEGQPQAQCGDSTSARLRFRTSWSIVLTTFGILSQSRSDVSCNRERASSLNFMIRASKSAGRVKEHRVSPRGEV